MVDQPVICGAGEFAQIGPFVIGTEWVAMEVWRTPLKTRGVSCGCAYCLPTVV